MRVTETSTIQSELPAPVLPHRLEEPTPERFRPPKTTLFVDRFMTHFIKIGGISIVTAVFGIFLFILIQILPLFRDARVQPHSSIPMPSGSYEILGIDEWGELPFVVDNTGKVRFFSLATQKPLDEGIFPFGEEKKPVLGRYKPETHGIVYAFEDG